MGINLTPILANLYLAMLQEELKKKCIFDKKLKYWIKYFNSLSRTIYSSELLDFKVFQKEIITCMYIPFSSDLPLTP